MPIDYSSPLMALDRKADEVYTELLKLQDQMQTPDAHELMQSAAKQMYGVMATLAKVHAANRAGPAESVRALASELHRLE